MTQTTQTTQSTQFNPAKVIADADNPAKAGIATAMAAAVPVSVAAVGTQAPAKPAGVSIPTDGFRSVHVFQVEGVKADLSYQGNQYWKRESLTGDALKKMKALVALGRATELK